MLNSSWINLLKKKSKTIGFKAHPFTKFKPQKSHPEMEYCHTGMNIWSDLLRHFAKCTDAQGPPCTFHAADNHNLNKMFILYILSRLATVYIHAQFFNLSDSIYTYTWNIQEPRRLKGFSRCIRTIQNMYFSLRKSLFTSPLKTDFNIFM